MTYRTEESPSERRLITEIKRRFGDPLGELLLAGYGEDEIRFNLSFLVKESTGLKRDLSLRLTTEDPEGLPNKREPLVLLALLSLLRKKDDVTNIDTLVMTPEPVIRQILGWESSVETDRIIHSAIRKYYHLSYTAVVDGSQSAVEMRGYSIHSRRLLVSCGYRSGSAEANELEDRECSYVELSTEMRIDVMEQKLFGITWYSATLVNC
jgi:hypothetical protein